VKQFERIPLIAYRIKKLTTKPFFWYIIGSGETEETIRSEIKKYNLQKTVVLLGAKDNPYPYVRTADLLVCTSSSESFSYVIAEAKVLHTPVLSNQFPVAKEVVDNMSGWMADLDEFPQLLALIIGNVNGEYDSKKSSIANYQYDNEKSLRAIDSLLLR
jgi:hypothetical protein